VVEVGPEDGGERERNVDSTQSDFVADLTEEAIDTHMEHGPKMPSVHTGVHLYLDGAIHDVGEEETELPRSRGSTVRSPADIAHHHAACYLRPPRPR
jgi:hypothetical protein